MAIRNIRGESGFSIRRFSIPLRLFLHKIFDFFIIFYKFYMINLKQYARSISYNWFRVDLKPAPISKYGNKVWIYPDLSGGE